MRYFLLPLVLLLVFTGCEDADNDPEPTCGITPVYLEEDGAIISDPFQISRASIQNGCLEIEVVASGCDGSSWEGQLFVFPDVAESYPPQMRIALSLANQELCDAVISRSFVFDLSKLQQVSDRVILHLDSWEPSLLFPGMNLGNIVGGWSLTNVNGGFFGENFDFQPGDINWLFDEDQVTVEVNIDDEITGLLTSGVYYYDVIESEVFLNYPELVINEINLGPITQLTEDSLVLDQRPVDGFQYLFTATD